MFGAIIGDFVGSSYEFLPIYNRYFDFLKTSYFFTDDSVLTAALGEALIYEQDIAKTFVNWTLRYPNSGFGKKYLNWVRESFVNGPQSPGTSWGNGCLMRNSPTILLAPTLEIALNLSNRQCGVTHNHENSQLTTRQYTELCFETLIFSKEQEKNFPNLSIEKKIANRKNYFFNLVKKLNISFSPLDTYCMDGFHVGALETLPRVLSCIQNAETFTDVIRNAVYIGGDCDTNAAIAGVAAEIIYNIEAELLKDFIAFASYNEQISGDIIFIVALSYLKSPHKHYFFKDPAYLDVIETFLTERMKKIKR